MAVTTEPSPPLPPAPVAATALVQQQHALLLTPTQSHVVAALSAIHQLCLQVKDRQSTSLQVHARLHQVFLRIVHCATHNALTPGFEVSAFTRILNHWRIVLEQHVRLHNAALRALASRRFLAGVRRIHLELSSLITKWRLASATSTAMHWQQPLAVNTHLDEQTLHATLRAMLATPTFLAKEFRSERRQLHLLMDLVAEIAPERERAAQHSLQLLETLKLLYKRVVRASGLHVQRVPRWYLPRADVVCRRRNNSKANDQTTTSCGSTLTRGEYFGLDVVAISDSSAGSTFKGTHAVALKRLWPLRHVVFTQLEHLFTQTLQHWYHIDHPNVAQVRGACHVTSPPVIVRDYTAYGSLPTYIAAVEAHARRPAARTARANLERITWELLYGAGKGLLYLHEQMRVVHGGLRCNNILVNRFGQPVVADYGLRALAFEAQRHNLVLEMQDDPELVRWLAPECLVVPLPAAGSAPSSVLPPLSVAADVYAFGMCILEAVTGAMPWSSLDALEVATLKRNLGVLPPRPKRMHPNVWGLIQRMCVGDPKQRIGLRVALQEIKQLGYFGYATPAAVSMESTDEEDSTVLQTTATDETTGRSDSGIQAEKEKKDAVVASETPVGIDSTAVLVDSNSNAVELVYWTNQELQDVDFVVVDDDDDDEEEEATTTKTLPRKASVMLIASQRAAASLAAAATSHDDDDDDDVDDVEEDVVANGAAPLDKPHATSDALPSTLLDGKSAGHTGRRLLRSSSDPSNDLTLKAAAAYANAAAAVAQSAAPRLPKRSASSAALRRMASLARVPEEHLPKPKPALAAVERDYDDALTGGGSANIWDEELDARGDVTSIYHDARASPDGKDDDVAGSVVVHDAIGAVQQPTAAPAVDVEVVQSLHATPPAAAAALRTVESTLEPEHESAIDRSSSSNSSNSSVVDPTKSENAPLSRATEILNRMSSVGTLKRNGGDRSSFLDTLLRATTLRTDEYMTATETKTIDASAHSTAQSVAQKPKSPPLSTPMYVDTIESLKADRPPSVVLQALQMLRSALRQHKHKQQQRDVVDWTERGGIAAVLSVLSRNVSESCTCLALEILVEIAVQHPSDMEAIVDADAVAILLAFIARRRVSDELDLVASFLLELLASSDAAKAQLWATDGLHVLEANCGIDKRLVQEVKSIVAKWKASEGYKHMHTGEYDHAIDCFSAAIALDRKRATYYGDRSLAYYEASLFKKAADDGARCMRYNPYDAIGYLRNGMALKALSRYNEAIVCLRKGRQVDPKFAKLRDVLTEIEDIRRGRSREASPSPSAVAVANAPLPADIVKAKKKDGDDALRRKQYDVAIQCYTDALALDKRNDLLFLHRSIAYSGCGQFDKAVDDASRCIQINYRHAEGYYRLALALHSLCQFDQALRTLYRGQDVDSRHAGIKRFVVQLEREQAKRAGVNLPNWFKDKGYEAFQLRSYEEAIKFYSKGIAASPSDHDDVALHCFFYRARANQCRGEFTAVVMDCTHILHHDPSNVFARLRRADAFEQQQDFFMALQDMQELVMLNPDFASARARLESLEVRCRFLPRTTLAHHEV